MAENTVEELEQTVAELKKNNDTPEFTEERERGFRRFDLNGDGKISSAELGACLEMLGSVTSEEVQRMMQEIDTDKDQYISKLEFEHFAFNNMGLIKDVSKVC